MHKPLEGIKVVELATYIAGPGTARILADQGAKVIKFEPLKGGPFRQQGFLFGCPYEDYENPLFDIPNANKKFIGVDLRSEKGMEILHKALADADVLVTNYRQDALDKLHLSYEELSVKYPKLVYGHINSFGELGEDASRPGYDVVAYFARSGLALDTGVEGGIPLTNVGGAGDNPTAVALAQGITAALVKQQRTGEGDKVSVSLFHAAIWTLSTLIMTTQYSAKYPLTYNKPAMSPIVGHPYKCQDGKWVLIMLLDFTKYYQAFYKSIGREDLIENPDYNSAKAVKKNQKTVVEMLSEIIKTKPYAEWDQIWKSLDIPFEVIRSMKDVNEDEAAILNNFIRPITYPSGKTIYLATPPMQFKKMGMPEYKITGPVGRETNEIMRVLGYDEAEVEVLKNSKVIK